MPIQFNCAHCNSLLSVRDELAGRNAACPRCRGRICIPTPAADTTRPAANPSSRANPAKANPPSSQTGASRSAAVPAQNANSAHHEPAGKVAGVPASAATAGTKMPIDPFSVLTPEQIQNSRKLVVAAVKGKRVPQLVKADEYRSSVRMLYLVLISVPLVICAAFAVASFLLILFLGVCGLVFVALLGFLLVVMLATSALPALMARNAGSRGRRRLTPEGEPFFFQFVEHLCQMLGAPPPESIHVDCEINASASMGERGLILTIGLPLVAGLNMNQFVGVLAHEIGHFTQAEGMKSLNFFFKFQRWVGEILQGTDGMTRWLEMASYESNSFVIISWGWYAIRLMLALMLRGMMIFVGRLLQRMEFDADRYEGLMVGTKVFESTCYSLRYLGAGYGRSVGMLRSFARQKKLGDNLPKLIAVNSRDLPKEQLEEIHHKIQSEQQAGLTDSHPPDAQRIARVRAENQPGIFHVPGPTTALFNDFNQLCKNVTWDVYRGYFGANFHPQDMHSMDELVEQRQAVEKKTKQAEERFAGIFHPLRPIRNTQVFLDEDCDPQARKEELRNARKRLAEIQADYFAARQQFDQADKELQEADEAIAALTCAMYYPNDNTALGDSRNTAQQAKAAAEQKMQSLQPIMIAAEEHQGTRVMAALDLIAVQAVDVGDNERTAELASNILFGMHAIRDSLNESLHLRFLLVAQRSALRHLRQGEVPQPIVHAVMETNGRMHALLSKMRQHLDAATYPFAEEQKGVTVGGFLGTHRFGNQHLGVMENPFELCEDMGQFLDDFYLLYRELTAHLIEMVEQVETALALPPLPQYQASPKRS